jgi:2-dehydro-3-deoxyphosphogluconate aldolase/(4S)-4-hydroxy-2-oxoglutarate aldolase
MTRGEFTSHVDHAPRTEIVRRIAEEGIVPVIRAATPDLALRAARAVMAGGISVFEITMTVPDAPDVIRALVRELGDRALVGAGTVLNAAAAHQCIDAGAAFVVSPGLDPDTVIEAHGRGVPAMPGALTPTEVIAAWNLGADVVKIFPISAMGGAKYLRALRAPLPEVKMMPTGGITAANAAEFLAAGAVALGIGGELVDTAALAEGRDATITERARELRAVVQAARAALSARTG